MYICKKYCTPTLVKREFVLEMFGCFFLNLILKYMYHRKIIPWFWYTVHVNHNYAVVIHDEGVKNYVSSCTNHKIHIKQI